MADGMATIYIMGKRYDVPSGLTIMKALEYAGYRLVRGTGCRGGFCGACGTVYRKTNDYKIRPGLACMTIVEDGMYLTQIPFYPANKALYNIENLKPTAEQILAIYPEVYRCLSCNTCTKICPQDIDVMEYVNAALRGDIERVAKLSSDCIMCGLCASRCPAEIVQYFVGILCKRIYGRYVAPKASYLEERVGEISAGKFDGEIRRLMRLDLPSLEKLYKERTIEPE